MLSRFENLTLGCKRSYSVCSSDYDSDEYIQPEKKTMTDQGLFIINKTTISKSLLLDMQSMKVNDDESKLDIIYDGCSDYDQSDQSDDSSKHHPLSLLSTQRIQKRFAKTSTTSLVNTHGSPYVVSKINSIIYEKWNQQSFIAYSYRFNRYMNSWTKKGPISINLESTRSGNARLNAHYLYGTNSILFNMKCRPFINNQNKK